MRRLFIIRKDLNLSAGKLAAMVAHCAEGYWTRMLKIYAAMGSIVDNEIKTYPVETPKDPDYWTRYRNPALYEAAKAAHERGEKTFQYPREDPRATVTISVEIPKDVWTEYVNGLFTKTICEAKNLNHLMKVEAIAAELGLIPEIDYGFIDDACLTELKPEATDESGKPYCRVGVWFKPLPDEASHQLSRKYQLYRDWPKVACVKIEHPDGDKERIPDVQVVVEDLPQTDAQTEEKEG